MLFANIYFCSCNISRVVTDVEYEPGPKAAWTAAAVLLVAALTGAVVLSEWPLWGVGGGGPSEPNIVQPGENGSELWPYTARGTSYSQRTLGINVVVIGDTENTHQAMVERSEMEWRDPDDPEAGSDETQNRSNPDREQLGESIDWGRARGAVRYTQVIVEGQRRWIDESYQLHSGNYLGQRMHVRAYEDPKGEWTAMQAHTEHWDWFRLRHTVTGISDAQRDVERDFMDAPFVEEVSRKPYENGSADSEGWVTVIRLWAFLFAGLGLTLSGRSERAFRTAEHLVQRHRREVTLGATLFALYLGVRAAGIGLETALPWVNPKIIAAPLYVALVVGLPGLAYHFGRGTNRVWAFTHAVGALGTAFIVDFAVMGVSVVPMPFVLHRVAVLSSIGLIAVGSTFLDEDDDRMPLVIGLVGWIAALALPAFGYI